jgi:myo-inositol-1(or 4)-monophosphatase
MNLRSAQDQAIKAALSAGKLMRKNLATVKRAHAITQHDIKLELDVRCQELIERTLHAAFPEVDFLGEEGVAKDNQAEYRWVVDPIDGTVNYAYGLPHACVSIALQGRVEVASDSKTNARRNVSSTPARTRTPDGASPIYPDGYQTLMGLVYDPFREELWRAMIGKPATLNGKPIHVSKRQTLKESMVTMGLSKTPEHLKETLPVLGQIASRVRKVRILGAAALDLAYVATGRFDAFMERGIRLWDIAAGGLLVQCAGGHFFREPIPGDHAYRMIASNGFLYRELRLLGRKSHFN